MKKAHIITAIALILLQTPSLAADKLWSLSGFDQPESVLHDEKKQLLYVSNINGSPVEANGLGYISKVSMVGKLLKKEWVTGLGSPKGMAIFKNSLFVADLNVLREIDKTTGKLLKSHKAENSKMLNDVTIDEQGIVYVTDLLAGKIFRLNDNTFELWFESKELPHPNGIQYHKGKLLIGSWGTGMQDDFSTKEAGSLYSLDPSTKQLSIDKSASKIGNLDGVSLADENTIISIDWINGNVFKTTKSETQILFNAGKGAADISVSDKKLYVPMMLDNRIDVYSLGE